MAEDNAIGENLNVNRCPQADYDGYPCAICKAKYSPEIFRKCGNNKCVSENGKRWWEKDNDAQKDI